jgi:GT2 family glycosyltransferase
LDWHSAPAFTVIPSHCPERRIKLSSNDGLNWETAVENRRLSVIIPTYRRGHDLLETMASIMPCLGPRDEVLIVDQQPVHSPDMQQRILEWTRDSRVRLWQLPVASLTLARNFGGLLARAPVLIYLDDDVTVKPGFFEAHWAKYESADVEAVAGHVYIRGNRWWPKNWDRNRRFQEYAIGCNMSIRRSAFERLGGFDLNFQGNFQGEDNDFIERVRFSGGKIADGFDCPLDHRQAETGGCDNRDRDDRWRRYYMQNHLYWCLKRPLWKKLTLAPGHIARRRHFIPSGTRKFQPSYWTGVFLTAAWTAIKLAMWGAKPPFWPSPTLLATPPMMAGDTTCAAQADWADNRSVAEAA